MSMSIENEEARPRTGLSTGSALPFHKFARVIGLIRKRHRAAGQHRHAVTALMRLDNHTLKDIGLDRSEIRSLLTDTNKERRRSMPLSSCHGQQGEAR